MPVPIRMPDLGTTVEEFVILDWLIKEGDTVRRGDEIAEIETDKATVALESPSEGVLLKLTVRPGETAHTGDVLAYLGQPGEVVPEEPIAPVPDDSVRLPDRSVEPTVSAPARVSQIVRNLAAKLGVDIARLHGTGQGGVITREDVLRASREAPVAPAPSAEGQLSRVQRAVSRAVTKSWTEIPHIRFTATLDMTAAGRIREQSEQDGAKTSYDAILLKAMASGIAAVPLFASRLNGERVIRAEGIHIALAVGIEDELFMPVIRDVDQKDIAALQAEIVDLVAAVRARAARADQMTGACMALSNLGMYPIECFDAIIFPEHSAILSAGAVEDRPVVIEGRVEVRPMMKVSLAADHRLINGRAAGLFIIRLKEAVESGDLDSQK